MSLPSFQLLRSVSYVYLNVIAGAQSISFKHIQDMEVTMATFVSEINDRLSLLEKRMDKIDPSWLVENKHTHYPSPENAGTRVSL